MSKIVRAVSPEVAEPQAGTWSNCLVVNGVAYVAGMTAAGTEGDEYAQAKVIFTKIRHLLAAAGGSMADVVKVTAYLEDARNFGRYNKVFGDYFPEGRISRTTVEANAVIECKIEMDAVAYKPRV